MEEKMSAMKKVLTFLERSSYHKEQCINLIKGQFAQLLQMFLVKEVNSMVRDYPGLCETCQYAGDGVVVSVQEHALMILNRCLTNQVNIIIRDKIDKVLAVSFVQDQPLSFGVSEQIVAVLWEELGLQINMALGAISQKSTPNFVQLGLLTQAFTNMLIVEPSQKEMMIKAEKTKILQGLLQIL